jgi:hypothetical protein
VIRRIRGERLRLRSAESADDRASRRKARHGGLVMVGAGLLIGGAGLIMDQETGGAVFVVVFHVPALVLLFYGLLLFWGSLAPRPELDPATRAINERRNRVFWTLLVCADWPDKVVPHAYQHAVARWEIVPVLAGLSLMLWPRKYWMFGGLAAALPAPQVWSPFVSTRREADHEIHLPVDAPSGPGQIGGVILTRADESRVGIRRVFASADALRLFAPVGIGDSPVHVTVKVLTAHDDVVAEFQPPMTMSTPVEHSEWWRRPVPPTAQIDLSIPLRGFAPGNYRLLVTATAGDMTCEQYTDFRLVPTSKSVRS